MLSGFALLGASGKPRSPLDVMMSQAARSPVIFGCVEVEKDEEMVCRKLQNHALPSVLPSAKAAHIE